MATVVGTDSDGGPERTLYRSTSEGTRELLRWAHKVTAPAPFVTNEIFGKVVVAILRSSDAQTSSDGEGLDAASYLLPQRAAHIERVDELTALRSVPGASLSTVRSVDYALAHLEVDLQWMATAATRLDTLAAEIAESAD